MLCLGPDDDVVARLGRVPRRIAVAGVSGSGKTTTRHTYDDLPAEVGRILADNGVVRLRSRREVERWLAALPVVDGA